VSFYPFEQRIFTRNRVILGSYIRTIREGWWRCSV